MDRLTFSGSDSYRDAQQLRANRAGQPTTNEEGQVSW